MELVFWRLRVDLPWLPSSQCFFLRRRVRNTVGCLVNSLNGSRALGALLPKMKVRRRKKESGAKEWVPAPLCVCLSGNVWPRFHTPFSRWRGGCAEMEIASICYSPVWTVVTLSLFCQHRYALFVLRAPTFTRVQRIVWLQRSSFISNWICFPFFPKDLDGPLKISAGLLFCF